MSQPENPSAVHYRARLAMWLLVLLSNLHVMCSIFFKKQHLVLSLLHHSRFGSCNLYSIRDSRIISDLKGFNCLITMRKWIKPVPFFLMLRHRMLYQLPKPVSVSSHDKGAALSWVLGREPTSGFHSRKAGKGAGAGGSSEDWVVNFKFNLNFLLNDK